MNSFRHVQLQDLLGNPNGEQFMELATPLHDSAVLRANTLICSSESSRIDAPSVPLPPSPLSSCSPLQSPISSAQSGRHSQLLDQPQSSRISKGAQMSRIEDELLDARRDLKEKETALNELRAVVENLRRQAVGRGPHGPGELDNVLWCFPLMLFNCFCFRYHSQTPWFLQFVYTPGIYGHTLLTKACMHPKIRQQNKLSSLWNQYIKRATTGSRYESVVAT